MELYTQILDNGGPAFGHIFRHVRDHPDKACIFHCTGDLRYPPKRSRAGANSNLAAGKDRTGVAAALLLKVSPGILSTLTSSDRMLVSRSR